jgi:hypothetical protein
MLTAAQSQELAEAVVLAVALVQRKVGLAVYTPDGVLQPELATDAVLSYIAKDVGASLIASQALHPLAYAVLDEYPLGQLTGAFLCSIAWAAREGFRVLRDQLPAPGPASNETG